MPIKFENDTHFGDNKEKALYCCDSPEIHQEDGFNVCLNCGLVYSRVLNNSPRRVYTPEEIKTRKSSEPVYNPFGPRTIIKGIHDAKGILLSPKYKSKFNRLAKIQRSLTTSYERNLWIVLPNLQRLQERLRIPDTVAQDALRIYTQTVKSKLTMGRSIDTLLAASIFSAFKIHGIPRTFEEVSDIAQIPRKKVFQSYKLIFTNILPNLNLKVQHFSAERYIDKFTEELKLSMRCRNSAVKLILKAKKSGLDTAGKDPKGFAAGAIYIASKICNEHCTQNEISQHVKITEVTLRTRVKELRKYIHLM